MSVLTKFANADVQGRATTPSRGLELRRRYLPSCLLWLVLVCFAAFLPLKSSADTVTNCTIQALMSALKTDYQAIFEEDCSITFTNTILVTNGDMFIDGTGLNVTLSGDSSKNFRLFTVKEGNSLTLQSVILSGGRTNLGGAIYVEPGASLFINDCIFLGNLAIGTNGAAGTNGNNVSTGTGGNGTPGRSGAGAMGGAIFNLGSMSLSNCMFFTNSATGGNGGVGGNGGSGRSKGGNGASGGSGGIALGGAIFDGSDPSDPATIIDCTFSGNSVIGGSAGEGGAAGSGPSAGLKGGGGVGQPAYGGGIMSTGQCIIQRCTFSSNLGHGGTSTSGAGVSGTGSNGAKGGDAFGGGIYVRGADDFGLLENCTFASNALIGGNGGDGGPGTSKGGNGGNGGNAYGSGIYNTGKVHIVSCTLAYGTANGGTNGAGGTGPFAGSAGVAGFGRGAGFANGGGTSTLHYSLLATNVANNLTNGINGNIQKIAGTITDLGYNLSSDNSYTFVTATTHSRSKLDVFIGSLGDNGGLTQTIPILTPDPELQKTNPAMNTIPIANSYPATDQRLVNRPVGSGADIGAFEVGPSFTVFPTNVTAIISGEAIFVAEVQSEDPQYSWQFNHTNISDVTDENTLTVTNLTAEIRGPYRVVVTDSLGSISSPDVFVNFSPTLLAAPVNVTATEHSNATFNAIAAGDPSLVFFWMYGTNLVKILTNSSSPITNTSSITISDVNTNNTGNYTLTVSNRYGKITSPAFVLAIGVAPSIQSPPANVITNVGSIVTFSVTAAGTPTPGYQWQFNGTDLGGQNGSTFTLNNVQLTNQGTYSVTVSNNVATNTASATLTVVTSSAPIILSGPNSLNLMPGATATFNVSVTGTSPFTYQWRVNANTIVGAIAPTYSLTDVQAEDAGTYDVIVGNSFGSTRSPRATLTIVTQINQPTLIANKSNFNFNSIGGASYVVEYSTNLGTPNWRALSTNPGTGAQMIIPDTVTATNRFYRVRVQ